MKNVLLGIVFLPLALLAGNTEHKSTVQANVVEGYMYLGENIRGSGVTVTYKSKNYWVVGASQSEYRADTLMYNDIQANVDLYLGHVGIGYSDTFWYSSLLIGGGVTSLNFDYSPEVCRDKDVFLHASDGCTSDVTLAAAITGEVGVKYGVVGLGLQGGYVYNDFEPYINFGLALIIDIPLESPKF
ncbi:MAG: hypothetical protein OCC49_00440 [Fibrobacterales bacterium]